MQILGEVRLPTLDGVEIQPNVFLIGEPTPRPDLGPTSFACLANVAGALCLVELTLRLSATMKRG